MLELFDPHVRLVVLNHIAARLTEVAPQDLTGNGIDGSQWSNLRRLNALDLSRLASTPALVRHRI